MAFESAQLPFSVAFRQKNTRNTHQSMYSEYLFFEKSGGSSREKLQSRGLSPLSL
jgi:hypothetical protein